MDFAKRIHAPYATQQASQEALKAKSGSKGVGQHKGNPNEVVVGFEKDTNKLVTLRDLYESAKVKSESGVMFTPLITKQLKRRFDTAYASYKESRGDIAEIEPQYVRELLQNKCTEFFNELRYQVKTSQEQCTERIRKSQTLLELDQLFDKNKTYFDTQTGQGFDLHKDKFDDKISRFRFSSVIKNKSFYEELIQKIDQTRESMDGLYQNIQDVESRVVQVQDQTSDFLQLKVGELISDSLKFDVCSQELVGYRPDKEVEILEIDENPARLIPGGDFNESSAYSNIFSGTHTTWGNGHELLTDNHDVYRHFGMNV